MKSILRPRHPLTTVARAALWYSLGAGLLAAPACAADDAEDARSRGEDVTVEGVRFETLHIAAERVACVFLGPMQCLQVQREGQTEWRLFYSEIEGFSFEAGNRYTLRVRIEPVADPPADASSLRYVLVEVVSREPAR
ncbi:MAG TPA: DUF4377 domain-containing protein [Polyangiaceae bacterium]|nr:DUF4377 domain-containing protein [Polyangiaceae bacterium]